MKKLILIVALLFSLTMSAQKEQIVKDYNYAYSQGEYKEVKTRFFFNYGGDNSKVRVYIGDKVFNLTQIGATKEGETESRIKYQLLILLDNETLEKLYLQYFETDSIRIIFNDEVSIEFMN